MIQFRSTVDSRRSSRGLSATGSNIQPRNLQDLDSCGSSLFTKTKKGKSFPISDKFLSTAKSRSKVWKNSNNIREEHHDHYY